MKEQRRAARTVLGWFALAALTPLGLTFAWLPARLGLWVGARLGDLAWTALPRRRTVALENLARAFPGRSATELARIGRASFRHLGMNFVESCVFFFRPPARLLSRVSVDGLPNVEAAHAIGLRSTVTVMFGVAGGQLCAHALPALRRRPTARQPPL